jgi:lactose/L-arabinose transport system substrate-binding protein
VIWAWSYYIDAAHAAVRLYQENNPDSNIEFEIIELGQYDAVQRFIIALASGNKANLPDIIVEEYYNFHGYMEFFGKFFVDLTPYIDPSLYAPFTVRNVTFDNKLWGVPYSTGAAGWFYRIDVLEEAGFTEADLQYITWDRFIEIGQVVKERTGMYMIPIVPEGNIEGRVMIRAAGSWYFDFDNNLDIVNNQAIAEMTETVKRLVTSGVAFEVSSWDDLIGAFSNNIAAGAIGGHWWAPIISENEAHHELWRVAPIPRMTNVESTHYSSTGGAAWFVLDRDNQQQAINFLMQTLAVSDDIANELIGSHMVVPALLSGRYTENARAGHPFFGGRNLVEIMMRWSENVPLVNYGSHPYEIAYFHGALKMDFIRGITTLEEVIEALQRQAEIIINH